MPIGFEDLLQTNSQFSSGLNKGVVSTDHTYGGIRSKIDDWTDLHTAQETQNGVTRYTFQDDGTAAAPGNFKAYSTMFYVADGRALVEDSDAADNFIRLDSNGNFVSAGGTKYVVPSGTAEPEFWVLDDESQVGGTGTGSDALPTFTITGTQGSDSTAIPAGYQKLQVLTNAASADPGGDGYNTTIGVNTDLDTSGLEVIDTISLTNGVIDADITTRNLALTDFSINATAAEIDVLDGITATTAELNILDGVTSTAAELNILDGVTATTAEINILDGVTSTAAELNILDGVTATAAEINILDGVTSTTAELNILDGVTSTAAELNILDGVTSTAAEINLLDGASAGTIVNSVAVVYGAAGEVNATTLQIAGTSITSTAAELNVLDGITSTTAELNILDGVTATAAEINILDGVTSTTAELNILDGVTATTAELNILDGVTSTAAELNLLDGASAGTIVNSVAVVYGAAGEVNATTLQIAGTSITSTAAELNVLDGITSTTAELNILDGVTATAAEINILDGVTSTTAELNILDGVTSTTAELNILDGVTSTTAELNILDGVTSTAAELNLLDGATANTVVNGKAVIYGSSGEVAASSLDVTGNVTVGGNLTIQGDFVQETSTNVIFEDTFLDLNVPDAITADITTDSGFRFGTAAATASVLTKHAQFTYDASNDLFKFTREADAGDFSAGQALSGADNVKALKFDVTTDSLGAEAAATNDLADLYGTANTARSNNSNVRSVGAVSKCTIDITTDANDDGTNYAPVAAASIGYPIQHDLNTSSVFVFALKTHQAGADGSGGVATAIAEPQPVFCKFKVITADIVEVSVGITKENEKYDIIVIG